jgi:hypothetical protein
MRPASQRNGQGVSWTLKSHSWARVDQGAAGSGGGRESGGRPAATIDAAAKAERVYSRQSLARHLNKRYCRQAEERLRSECGLIIPVATQAASKRGRTERIKTWSTAGSPEMRQLAA